VIKRLAILLLRITGSPDLPTREYAEQLFTGAGRGSRNLVDYYDAMSHGRLDIGPSQVFGWMDYGHSVQDLADVWNTAKSTKKKELTDAGVSDADAEEAAERLANATRRDTIKKWGREAAVQSGIDLSGFQVTVYVFNTPIDYFGSYGEAVVNWNAEAPDTFSLDLTGVSHETGHALGLASHSRLENSAEEYGDPWDIMSAYDGVMRHDSGGEPDSTHPYFSFGPGLNAANMDLVDWLDESRVFTGSGSLLSFRLRPLHERNLSGWLAARIPVGLETLLVEFRMDDGWDAGIPDPCILLHRLSTHPTDGRPCSELLLADAKAEPDPRAELRDGESFETGDSADPFGFFARVTVTRIDVANREALIDVHVRQRRQIEPTGTPLDGVTVDGGGLVWTPGRGFVKVPPHSPLLRVLEMVADTATLEGVTAGGRGNHIDQLALERLSAARDHLTTVIDARNQPKVPAPPSVRFTTGTD
jgi:M6 family metalloprotease-like protein